MKRSLPLILVLIISGCLVVSPLALGQTVSVDPSEVTVNSTESTTFGVKITGLTNGLKFLSVDLDLPTSIAADITHLEGGDLTTANGGSLTPLTNDEYISSDGKSVRLSVSEMTQGPFTGTGGTVYWVTVKDLTTGDTTGPISLSVVDAEDKDGNDITADVAVQNGTLNINITQTTHMLDLDISGNGAVTVTVDGNEEGTYSSDTQVEIAEGANVDMSTFPDSGWQFDSFSGDVPSFTMDSDKHTTATFYGETPEYVTIDGPTEVSGTSGSIANYTCTAHFNDGSSLEVTNSASWDETFTHASISSGTLTVTDDLSSDESGEVFCSYTQNGNTESSSMSVTLTDEGDGSTHCIFVTSGWNLMSLPVRPSNNASSAVFNEVPGTLYLWEYAGGDNWNTAQRGTLASVSSLGGYYLWLPNDTTVNQICTAGTALTGSQSIDLEAGGWKLLSVPYEVQWGDDGTITLGDGTETNNLPDAVNEGWVHNEIWEFMADTQSFQTFTVSDNKTLDSGKGYWIYTLKSGLTINFSETTGPEPPPTPSTTIRLENVAEVDSNPPIPEPPAEDLAFDLIEVTATSGVAKITFRLSGEGAPFVNGVKVEVLDSNGRRLKTLESGGNSVNWSTADVPNGLYLYMAFVDVEGGFSQTNVGKVLVLD